jgi:HupE / UreJ protein
MSELWVYLQLGFHHVASPGAFDHLLFLLALAAVYRPQHWRDGLWVISAFTLGHSLTLALVATGAVRLPEPWVEFLIPVTIVATAVANLLTLGSREARPGRRRAVYAMLFGLVHGAGFAGYLRSMFLDHIAVPLLGFNLGIEAGQILVLGLAGTALRLADGLLGAGAADRPSIGYHRRVVLVSLTAGVLAGGMALARVPG